MGVLSHLEPKPVFDYFEKLCAVPHGSGNTKLISDLCASFARELGLKYRQEECNNLIIWKDASAGYENAAPVILQGHMDMVCAQTEDCTKDMSREGLDLRTDGTYVWADKTSLGGDDCIAVATALAILADDSLPHPPLEVVFTIDEETGMDGAAALDCSDLKGRLLLNLDSEEEGVFTVACAGGLRADCFLPAARQALNGESCFSVSLSGLQGGHSGAEIDKGRGNAVQLMGRALYGAMEQVGALRIADLRGGQFDNVICPRCDAVVAVPAGKEEEFTSFVRKFDRIMKNELSVADGGVTLSCAAVSGTAAYDADASARMLHAPGRAGHEPRLPRPCANLPESGRHHRRGRRAPLLPVHPVLRGIGEGDAAPEGAGHRHLCRRHCLHPRRLPRVAVRPPVSAAGHGDGRLQARHRQGWCGAGYPRRSGVRPAGREDARAGRRVLRP